MYNKMKIVYCKNIPFRGYVCMMICGLLIVRKEYKSCLNETVISHERIHFEQQKEMLFLPFFVWYAVEWIVRLIQYGNTRLAYCNISFEREAKTNETNVDYLENRPTFNFLEYLTK